MAAGLPPYEERVLLSSMDTEPDGNGVSQRSGYDELYGTLRHARSARPAETREVPPNAPGGSLLNR